MEANTQVSDSQLLHWAQDALRIEAQALTHISQHLQSGFAQAVRLMRSCTGRVVVMGMGKSGHVGRKMAATLSSTGTPALFVHPAEAGHGDLGMVTPHDVVICKRLANVLAGGDTDISEPVTEQQLLDLEFEVFMEMVKHPATLARIEHMLNTGKPLRN